MFPSLCLIFNKLRNLFSSQKISDNPKYEIIIGYNRISCEKLMAYSNLASANIVMFKKKSNTIFISSSKSH